MQLMVFVMGTTYFLWRVLADLNQTAAPVDNAGNDMYFIHAAIYQIGILTNGTNATDYNATGNQESVTLYHTNGSNLDWTDIPNVLLTNVTAQSIVGVAAAPEPHTREKRSAINDMASPNMVCDEPSGIGCGGPAVTEKPDLMKTTTQYYFPKFKRDVENDASVQVEHGYAAISPEAAVQSIALAPLLFLKNNISQIPVPIPNTLVVNYTKASEIM